MIAPNEDNQYYGLGLSAFDHNLSRPRHRWFEFKEGFSEALVLEAIHQRTTHKRKPRLLDPFAGSGTTLVTAGRFGFEATGVEVNPFLVFASRAKCTANSWRHGTVSHRLKMILQDSQAEAVSRLEGLSTFTERKGLRNWLFNRSVLRGFASIDAALQKTGRYRMPLRLALLAALADCCNAKRDGKCLRYRDNWQSLGLTSADLRRAFERRAKCVVEDVCNHSFVSDGLRVWRGDARKVLCRLGSKTHDLVVTSPPYLNSFDYSDVYRPEMFVGNFVASNQELRKIRLKTIRSHVQVSWQPEKEIVSALLHPLLKQIRQKELWDTRLPNMVQSYFFDMAQVFLELKRILKPGGQSWIVVSTSAYAGVEIPVDLILADVASRQGWKLRDIHVLRQLRSAGQQWSLLKKRCAKPPLRESLIILERR